MHEATTPIAYRGTVCRPGRTFLRRLIDLLDSACHPSHHIHLTKCSLKDILLVVKILTISLERLQFLLQHCMMNSGLQVHVYICTPMPVTPHLAVCLIVCGFPRCSNYVGIPSRRSITFNELFAITVAVTIWSMFLQSRKIIFHCDNQSVIHILAPADVII